LVNSLIAAIMVSIVCLAFLTCCSPKDASAEGSNVAIANPASANCEEQGGKLEIRTAEDGSQAGYCILKDGSECEEWAFYRGECGK